MYVRNVNTIKIHNNDNDDDDNINKNNKNKNNHIYMVQSRLIITCINVMRISL